MIRKCTIELFFTSILFFLPKGSLLPGPPDESHRLGNHVLDATTHGGGACVSRHDEFLEPALRDDDDVTGHQNQVC